MKLQFRYIVKPELEPTPIRNFNTIGEYIV